MAGGHPGKIARLLQQPAHPYDRCVSSAKHPLPCGRSEQLACCRSHPIILPVNQFACVLLPQASARRADGPGSPSASSGQPTITLRQHDRPRFERFAPRHRRATWLITASGLAMVWVGRSRQTNRFSPGSTAISVRDPHHDSITSMRNGTAAGGAATRGTADFRRLFERQFGLNPLLASETADLSPTAQPHDLYILNSCRITRISRTCAQPTAPARRQAFEV